MRIKCLKCEKVKELDKAELQEVGEFVEKRKLRVVHFLKFLSMDLREDNLCTNGKNHEYEFESSFDKEIHALAADVKGAKAIVAESEKEILECERIIAEITAKAKEAEKRSIENGDKTIGLLEKMKTIAWIPDEALWT